MSCLILYSYWVCFLPRFLRQPIARSAPKKMTKTLAYIFWRWKRRCKTKRNLMLVSFQSVQFLNVNQCFELLIWYQSCFGNHSERLNICNYVMHTFTYANWIQLRSSVSTCLCLPNLELKNLFRWQVYVHFDGSAGLCLLYYVMMKSLFKFLMVIKFCSDSGNEGNDDGKLFIYSHYSVGDGRHRYYTR